MFKKSRELRSMFLVFFSVMFLISCTSYNLIYSQSKTDRPEDLKKGDIVEILTKDGKVVAFKILSISRTSITGRDIEIFWEDIIKIKKLTLKIDMASVLIALPIIWLVSGFGVILSM